VLQRYNQIGDDGAKGLGEGLKVNSSLRELDLVRHFVFDVDLFVAGAMQGEGGEGAQRLRHVSHLFAGISILWPIQRAWLLFSFARLQKYQLSIILLL
jgi:hypothetical protein